MASNLNYKQVANVSRRTWDVETYEKKAQERQKRLESEGDGGGGGPGTTASAVATTTNGPLEEEFRPADKDRARPEGSQRAFLKARKTHTDIDGKIGTTEMVNHSSGVSKSGVGWHCKVCDCFLKDSHTYLDHINGRKHQAKLGYSMRVERSTKEQVAARLAALQEKKQEQQAEDVMETMTDFGSMVRQKDEAARKRKEERRRKRKERKLQQQQRGATSDGDAAAAEDDETTTNDNDNHNDDDDKVETNPAAATTTTTATTEKSPEEEEEDVEEEAVDPALAAMMGFGGFGGGNKNG